MSGEPARALLRWALAALMLLAGVAHMVATEAFLGQLPSWLPLRRSIVVISGAVEIAFGLALLLAAAHRRAVGWALALFFVAVFPANVYQAVAGTDAFGLDTPAERWWRLAFQPLLIAWALWSTSPGDLTVGRRPRGR